MDIQTIDRALRDEIPIHRVAERLVDAHTVLIDRHALRGADGGRGLKAAILHVRLERVDCGVVDEHARDLPHQGVRHALRFGRLEVFRGQCLRIGRDLVAVDQSGLAWRSLRFAGRSRASRAVPARNGRRGDDADLRERDRFLRARNAHERRKAHRAGQQEQEATKCYSPAARPLHPGPPPTHAL